MLVKKDMSLGKKCKVNDSDKRFNCCKSVA